MARIPHDLHRICCLSTDQSHQKDQVLRRQQFGSEGSLFRRCKKSERKKRTLHGIFCFWSDESEGKLSEQSTRWFLGAVF